MLAQQRHNAIVAKVQEKGTVQVQDLAGLLNVSAMTVRRDLAELEEQGLLRRVHGGATISESTHEPIFAEKTMLNAESKAKIAKAAAQLVRSGQSIAIGGGSTSARLAQEIAARTELENLTIVTNSLPVSDFFHGLADTRNKPKVLLIGGERTPSEAFVGPLADATLANLNIDVLFLGAHGVTLKGMYTPNMNETSTNRTFIANTHDTVAVFDSSKWNVAGLSRFASWADIDTVVTDELTQERHNFLSDNLAKVITA